MKSFIQYINEVKESDLESQIQNKIEDAQDEDFSSYAFNHIFGNKLRLVIPLNDDKFIALNQNQVKSSLEEEGFNNIDFEKGTADKTIQTKDGSKLQEIKFGKIFQKLSKSSIISILEKEGINVDFENNTAVYKNKIMELGEILKSINKKHQITKLLEQEGFSKIDFKKGNLYKSQIKQTLGQAIKFIIEKKSYWKQVLHWWELKKDKTKSMGDATGISIIISRSPIDIIRMSDHKEWHSCHAPPGKRGYLSSYWPCAGQEARTGGAIAYVVRNKDLQKIDNLQSPEIFSDPDRGVDGIEPLERLRLRRFTALYGYDKYGFEVAVEDIKPLDILIPEKSVYGIRHVGFYEKVMAWSKNVQKPYLNFSNPPDWENVILRGGTYQDTDADQIWNAFFPNANVSGGKDSYDSEEQYKHGTPSSDSIYERAEEQLAARQFKHTFVTFDIAEEDHPILYWNGSTTFSYPRNDFIKISSEDDVIVHYSLLQQNNLGNNIKDALDFAGEGDINITTDSQYIYFNIPLNIDNTDYYTEDQNDRFESFLDWIERDIEQEYESYWGMLRKILISTGYLKDNWQWSKLKNFNIEEGDKKWKYELWISSDDLWIGNLQGIDAKNIDTYSGNITFPNHPTILKSINEIFPKFKILGSENIILKPRWLDLINNYIAQKEGVITHPIDMFLKIHILLSPLEYKRYYAAIKHIDDYWAQYQKRAEVWWNSIKTKLMGQQASINLPKIKKNVDIFSQLPLPFKDWVIISELPTIFPS